MKNPQTLPLFAYTSLMHKFGTFIARRRQELDLTQGQVAEKAGTTKATISRIESGEQKDIYLSTFIGLSRALRLSAEELVAVYLEKKPAPIAENRPEDRVFELAKALRDVLKERGLLD